MYIGEISSCLLPHLVSPKRCVIEENCKENVDLGEITPGKLLLLLLQLEFEPKPTYFPII
jgi:hypothetical protein